MESKEAKSTAKYSIFQGKKKTGGSWGGGDHIYIYIHTHIHILSLSLSRSLSLTLYARTSIYIYIYIYVNIYIPIYACIHTPSPSRKARERDMPLELPPKHFGLDVSHQDSPIEAATDPNCKNPQHGAETLGS